MELIGKVGLGPLRLSATGGWLGRFWSEQDGAMSYLALAGALVMMVFGGIGIDMMHAELKRTKLQNTLDRAVLAAADLDNEMGPEAVVHSYFAAMGMSDALTEVSVTETRGAKFVDAAGHQTMPSNFLGLLGIDTLQADGLAAAENARARTEISLVLDVSGSMSGVKIQQLKDAAKDFIDLVLPEWDESGRVSVSIVPYNATVNVGTTLAPYFNLEGLHDYSNCALFEDDTFSTTAIDPTRSLTQLSHFDLNNPLNANGLVDRPWCPTGDTAALMIHSTDAEALKARIDAFQAGGNTAIDLGVKWGSALLDPAINPAIMKMAADGLIDTPYAADLPARFDDPYTNKYLVVMTDGQNTTQYDLKPTIKHAASPVWVDTRGSADPRDYIYSIRVVDKPGTTQDVFYYPHRRSMGRTAAYGSGPFDATLNQPVPVTTTGVQRIIPGTGRAHPFGTTEEGMGRSTFQAFKSTVLAILGMNFGQYKKALLEGEPLTGVGTYAGPVQIAYQDLYGLMNMRTYANTHVRQAYNDGYASYSDYTNAYYAYGAIVDGNQADDRLSRICGVARDEGIQVYAIGVEAPARGLQAMQDCASSDSHYYDVQGDELSQTFSSIGRIVTELRLTQ
ncbi:VWA domain-containing protein [Aestuariicoccus sp. KMU-90]|uniref:VWA domain-containing protein n=2 Tax=Thetidibacter halocola TaxID=2827239 RepID=A0A8J7WHP1_9RHOB|nr:VWA domain-containing protein [Thetidibacter halocola]